MARIKLDMAYVGAGFAGWQIQPFAHGEPQRTVQGELEKAIAVVLGKAVRVHGAGRTDAGVHADRQTAHFDTPGKYRNINWPAALQSHLPQDVTILSATPVDSDFHARFSAKGKIYAYAIWLGSSPLPPKLRPFTWAPGPLDLDIMDEAARVLTGRHDFAAFQNSGSKVKDTVREIARIRRFYLPLPGEVDAAGSPLLAWEFTGNGFLKQMVRNLMGFMAACGRNKLSPADALALFAAGKRNALNFSTAPARGLSLRKVIY